MKIYLLDIDQQMIDAWKNEFSKFPEIEIVNDSFENFMDNHPDIQGVVSPANSFGFMDGGYDKAITDYFGDIIQYKVQQILYNNLSGYQQVGSCIAVSIDDDITLLHVPTMRIPQKITDPRIIFDCTINCMSIAKSIGLDAIVIPAFGACTGQVPKDIVAKLMSFAYEVTLNPIMSIEHAYNINIRLNKICEGE